MQRNILEYLEETVRKYPDKTAFANESMGMTFLEDQIDSECRHLLIHRHIEASAVDCSPERGDHMRVFLHIYNDRFFLIALLQQTGPDG